MLRTPHVGCDVIDAPIGRPRAWRGAVAGLVAALAALGVGELMSGLVQGTTGPVISVGLPTDFSLPSAPMRKIARLLPGMLAHSRRFPSAVIARFCGPLPRLGMISISVRFPSSPI